MPNILQLAEQMRSAGIPLEKDDKDINSQYLVQLLFSHSHLLKISDWLPAIIESANDSGEKNELLAFIVEKYLLLSLGRFEDEILLEKLYDNDDVITYISRNEQHIYQALARAIQLPSPHATLRLIKKIPDLFGSSPSKKLFMEKAEKLLRSSLKTMTTLVTVGNCLQLATTLGNVDTVNLALTRFSDLIATRFACTYTQAARRSLLQALEIACRDAELDCATALLNFSQLSFDTETIDDFCVILDITVHLPSPELALVLSAKYRDLVKHEKSKKILSQSKHKELTNFWLITSIESFLDNLEGCSPSEAQVLPNFHDMFIPFDDISSLGRLQGGKDTVYHACYKKEKSKEIVVKITDNFSRFRRESLNLYYAKQAGIPNIASIEKVSIIILDDFIKTINYVLIIPYYGEQTLYNRLHSQPPLSWQERVKIVLNLAITLTNMHGIILHNDLKSDNIILTQDLLPVIVDLGNAVLDSQLNLDSVGRGTSGWIAPEIFSDMSLPYATDIYSFGKIVLNSITLQHPLKITQIPGDCPKSLMDVYLGCCALDPGKRLKPSEIVSKLQEIYLDKTFRGSTFSELLFDTIDDFHTILTVAVSLPSSELALALCAKYPDFVKHEQSQNIILRTSKHPELLAKLPVYTFIDTQPVTKAFETSIKSANISVVYYCLMIAVKRDNVYSVNLLLTRLSQIIAQQKKHEVYDLFSNGITPYAVLQALKEEEEFRHFSNGIIAPYAVLQALKEAVRHDKMHCAKALINYSGLSIKIDEFVTMLAIAVAQASPIAPLLCAKFPKLAEDESSQEILKQCKYQELLAKYSAVTLFESFLDDLRDRAPNEVPVPSQFKEMFISVNTELDLLEKEVTVKKFDNFMAFKREASILYYLKAQGIDNIVPIDKVSTYLHPSLDKQLQYVIVMPRYQTLYDRLKSGPPLSLIERLKIALRLIRILEKMYRVIVHGALNSNNILLTADLCPIVANFEASKLHSELSSSSNDSVLTLPNRLTVREVLDMELDFLPYANDVFDYGEVLFDLISNLEPSICHLYELPKQVNALYGDCCYDRRLKPKQIKSRLLMIIATLEEEETLSSKVPEEISLAKSTTSRESYFAGKSAFFTLKTEGLGTKAATKLQALQGFEDSMRGVKGALDKRTATQMALAKGIHPDQLYKIVAAAELQDSGKIELDRILQQIELSKQVKKRFKAESLSKRAPSSSSSSSSSGSSSLSGDIRSALSLLPISFASNSTFSSSSSSSGSIVFTETSESPLESLNMS